MNKTKKGILAAAVVLIFLLSACAPGMSVDEAAELKEDIADIGSRLAVIESELQNADADDSLLEEISMVSERLSDIEGQLDDFVSPPAEEPVPMDQPAPAGDGF